jgi:hypothetical protein
MINKTIPVSAMNRPIGASHASNVEISLEGKELPHKPVITSRRPPSVSIMALNKF